ncbi:hypothetical protein V1292_000091 [Bradyrhizobium sp. AZCC 1719]
MHTARILGLVAVLSSSTSAMAEGEDAISTVDKLREKGYSVTSITPIFGQLLKMSYPRAFVPAFVTTKADFYIQESVPTGESINGWTQMISVTGRRDLATKPDATPKAFLNALAGGFKVACPSSYSVTLLSENKLNGYDAAVAVVSCGVSPTTAGKTSETALIAVIKGQTDVYTVQWAERAAPSNIPMQIDVGKWQDRFKTLSPIKLCPIVPGEKAPYPSCVGGEKSAT